MSNGVPSVGTVLDGKYRVDRVLGKGGMGCVLLARHLTIDEPVAIKLLHGSLAQDGELVLRFQREAKAARKIKSEHAVKILDIAALKDGVPYIVMELLEGTDLEAIVRSGPQPAQLAIDFVLQALEALAEAHVQGMVHRDLKPANLFVTRHADGSPLVKVLDFGISKVTGTDGADLKLTRTSAGPMGSPIYMAPEQLRGMRGVDARSDIWSLGVILYELLSGAPPFDGATMTELGAAIFRSEPVPLRNVPPALDHVVRRCLAKDQGARYQDVAALATDLAPFASPAGQLSVGRINGVLRMSGQRPSNPSLPEPTPTPRTTQAAVFVAPPPKPTSPLVYMFGGAIALVVVLGVVAVGGWLLYLRSQAAIGQSVVSSQPGVPLMARIEPLPEELAAPVSNLLSGSYGKWVWLQLSTPTPDAKIRYSLDDDEPLTWGGGGQAFKDPIMLETLGKHVLRAVALKDGKAKAMPAVEIVLSDDGLDAPSTVDFGSLMCGASATKSMSFHYARPAPERVTPLLGSGKSSPFSAQIVPTDRQTLVLGLTVPATPSSLPTLFETVSLTTSDQRVRTITLHARILGVVLDFGDTQPLDFGTVKPGATSDAQPVTVRNIGTQPALIQLTASDAFEVTPPTVFLSQNAWATVWVRFKPPAAGTFTSKLAVSLEPNSPIKPCFQNETLPLRATSK